jgi:imidazolonepropionase-like amidohydrolase
MHALIAEDIFSGHTLLSDQTNAIVVDNGGQIIDVGRASQIVTPAMSKTEVSGILMPGLLDMHTHICLSSALNPDLDLKAQHPARVTHRALENLALHLDAGVTTIRDVGGVHGIDIEISRLVREGKVSGPDVWAAGHLICMTGGHACFMGVEADSEDAIRQSARRELKAGAHLIKLIATGGIITPGVQPGAAQLTENEMRAGCEVAHQAQKKVAAHAQGADGIGNALRAGCDTIEHGFWLSDVDASYMKTHGRTLVPTFAPLRCMRAHAEHLPSFIQEKLDTVEQPQLESFQKAFTLGVQVVTGTDAGTPGNPHGNIAEELRAFSEAGMEPEAVWRAATSHGANALGAPDRGEIRRGMRADLIAISKTEFLEPQTFTRPHLVMAQGQIVRQET